MTTPSPTGTEMEQNWRKAVARIEYFDAGRDEGTAPTPRDFDELLKHAVLLKNRLAYGPPAAAQGLSRADVRAVLDKSAVRFPGDVETIYCVEMRDRQADAILALQSPGPAAVMEDKLIGFNQAGCPELWHDDM